MWKYSSVVLLCVPLAIFAAPVCAGDSTGVTGETIKIGMFGPMTGVASVIQKQIYGSAAIYKDANEHGGINGRKLELVIEDDGCNPGKGIAAVKKLLFQDNAFLLHGAWCSSVALAIKPELAKNPTVPYLVLGAASSAISTPVQPNIFHPIVTTAVAGRQMADFAVTKPGAKKFAIIRHSDEWGTIYSKAAIDRLKELGIEPAAVANFERGETDATSQVLSIKETAPDVVLAFLYPAEFAIYLREVYKYRIKTTTIGSTATSIDDAKRMVGIPSAMTDVYCAWPLADSLRIAATGEVCQGLYQILSIRDARHECLLLHGWRHRGCGSA